MKSEMNGKQILVTGGNSGIGKSVVSLLLEEGSSVFVVDINDDSLKDQKVKYGDRLQTLVYDLTNLENIESIFVASKNMSWSLNGLVHCAGISPLMKIEDNDVQKMITTYKINVLSFIELLKFFHNPQYTSDGGAVATMTSIATSVASFRQSVYSSSKAALEQVVKCAAKEFLDRKIRVNAVSAGAVETEMFSKLEASSEGLREKFERYYPLGMIPAAEIAKALVFLLSNGAIHIDGTILRIDSAFFVNK